MSRTRRTRLAVLFITALALAVRLFDLGVRVAHQDEARVAYWAYRYLQNGVYWYRPVVHGPFLTLTDAGVFGLLGPSDFSMRLVVAVVGGLLPLSAFLFRRRLRDSETVALAAVLAATPLFVYFSRFYRNDLLLAGFMFVAFGCFVRAIDYRRPAFLYLGTVFFALAFTTKENAVVYAVTWVGAAALLVDRRLLMRRVRGRDLPAAVSGVARRAAGGLRRWWPHAVWVVIEFFVILVFFYAPRGSAAGASPTLGATLADPTLLPQLIGEATLGSWHAFVGHWGSGNDQSYLSAAEALWPALKVGGLSVLVFGVVGFLLDRYTGDRPRDVVAFSFFWGLASLLGYPIVVANPFPWEDIHVVIGFVIPAAVGLAFLGRVGLRGLGEFEGFGTVWGTKFRDVDFRNLADRTTLAGVLAVVVLVVAAAHAGLTTYDTSFQNPQSPDNKLVQYAQSSSQMKPLLGELRGVVRTNGGTDVLYYGNDPGFDGDELAAQNHSSYDSPPAEVSWFRRLPFEWYFAADGAVTNSTKNATTVGRIVQNGDRPPIVVAFGPAKTCSKHYDSATDIDKYLRGYQRHEVQRFLFDSGCTVSTMEIYVDKNATG